MKRTLCLVVVFSGLVPSDLAGCTSQATQPAVTKPGTGSATGAPASASVAPAVPPTAVATPMTGTFAPVEGLRAAISRVADPAWAARLRSTPGAHDKSCYDDPDASGVEAVSVEWSAAHPGSETVVASLGDGVAVFDARGALLARSEPFDCLGSQTEFGTGGHVAVGQVLPDAEPEVVLHYRVGGRRTNALYVFVLKRRGTAMPTVFSGTAAALGPSNGAPRPNLETYVDGRLGYAPPSATERDEYGFNAQTFRYAKRPPVEALESEALADRACACQDNACAKNVFKGFEAWISANKGRHVSKAQARRVGQAAKRITECLMKQGITPEEIMGALRAPTK